MSSIDLYAKTVSVIMLTEETDDVFGSNSQDWKKAVGSSMVTSAGQ